MTSARVVVVVFALVYFYMFQQAFYDPAQIGAGTDFLPAILQDVDSFQTSCLVSSQQIPLTPPVEPKITPDD